MDIYEERTAEEEALNDTKFHKEFYGDACTCYRNVQVVNEDHLEIRMDYDPSCPNHGSNN